MSDQQYEVSLTYPFPELRALRNRILKEKSDQLFSMKNRKETFQSFESSLRSWLTTDKDCSIKNLNDLPHLSMGFGTLQIFQDFLAYRLKKRRLVLFPGEFPYYKKFCENIGREVGEINDPSQLKANDVLLISQPFYARGHSHPQFEALQQECEAIGARMIVDGAQWGTTGPLQWTVNQCIEEFWISFSKPLALTTLRVAACWSREPIVSQKIENHLGYWPLFGIQLVDSMIQQIGPCDLFHRYAPLRDKICQENHLQSCESLVFAFKTNGTRISLYDFYQQYFRKHGDHACGTENAL